MFPSIDGVSRIFKLSAVIYARSFTRSFAAVFASSPVRIYSALAYPSTSPELILYQPSRVSRISQALPSESVPITFAASFGSFRIFK